MRNLFRLKLSTIVFVLCFMVAGVLPASGSPQEKPDQAGEQAKEGKEADQEKKEKPKIKPYDEVITEKAVTSKGLFTTHMVEEKLYYEISADQLGRELLWVTQISKTQTSYGYGGTGVGSRVVRWVRHGDKILLRNVEYQLRAEAGTHEAVAVEASSVEAIIMAFDIVSFAEDKTPVIDVTGLFTGDTPEFSPKTRLRAKAIDKSRTFITSVKAFPINIETRVLATFKVDSSNTTTPNSKAPPVRRSDPTLGSVTVELHHSMVLLPEEPMQPRLFDKRVGFFTQSFEDYSSAEHEVEEVRYIKRWHLVKKDPDAELSEPVKPIVFYVGRGIPEKWRPYIKEGVESWQAAFEQAGFKNAIVARDAPGVEEDPDWDAEDARYSTIRWLPSTTQNAYGPHVADPRTGEILEADIRFFHNVIKLARDWYFVQASPNDARAQDLPLPDDLIGELLRYIAAHEVGHTLGFPHNMKASSSYTIKQLRDPEFTAKNGNEASIMDYGRFNYVAQPGDGARLIPIIGPYDKFSAEWGYKIFPDADTPEAERPHLNEIAARQLDNPVLRFGSGRGGDPSAQTEDLGSDAIEATRLGLLNLERVSGYLVEAACEEGEDYDQLANLHGQIIRQMSRELGHVANQVGGIVIHEKVYGQDPVVYRPVSPRRQREAVAFLLDNGFQIPGHLISDDVINRIGMGGISTQFLNAQRSLLNSLFSSRRIARMADIEAAGVDTYTVADLAAQLTAGIFGELGRNPVQINLFRRNLQRAYVELLIGKFTGKSAAKNDLQAVARGTAHSLLGRLRDAAGEAGDDITRYHLADLHGMIEAAFKAQYSLGQQ